MSDQHKSDDEIKAFFNAYRDLCRAHGLEFRSLASMFRPDQPHDCIIAAYQPERDDNGTVQQLYVYVSKGATNNDR